MEDENRQVFWSDVEDENSGDDSEIFENVTKLIERFSLADSANENPVPRHPGRKNGAKVGLVSGLESGILVEDSNTEGKRKVFEENNNIPDSASGVLFSSNTLLDDTNISEEDSEKCEEDSLCTGPPAKDWVTAAYESLATLYFLAVFLFLGPIALTILLAAPFIFGYWSCSLIYGAFWLWDLPSCSTGGRSGRLVDWGRNWKLWKYFVSYFPINLIKTAELDPSKNYLFCSHPHGILCFGVFGSMATEGANFSQVFPGIVPKLLTLEGNFWMPAFRELVMLSGACSSSKRSIETLLKSGPGVSPILVVGGVPEIFNPDPEKIVLVIKKRKGFLKLALQYGVDIVPVFSFGETGLYSQLTRLNAVLQEKLTKFIGFSPVMFSGRGFFQEKFGVLPYRREVNVVVGKPFTVHKKMNPSIQDVDALQEEYIAATVSLYKEHAAKYGHKDRELVIM